MITEGMDKAIDHFVEETMCMGVDANVPGKKVKRIITEDLMQQRTEMRNLIKMEAINLADKIIGKDHLLHSDPESDEFNPVDKAIFDMQVAQRIVLAEYQSKGKPTGPEEMINPDLAENEQ